MIGSKRILAVVPARGGSKRLPRKNLLPLAGKPLVQWSLEAALSAHLIDDVCLSSDSEEILDVGSMLNGLHLIRRPDELAIDSASSIDVVLNALTEMETVLDQRYTAVVLIQPTSPFVNSEDINGAINAWATLGHGSVISVCAADHPPLWTNTLPANLCMSDFIDPRYRGKRSQDFPKYYRLNGAVYVSGTESLFHERSFFQGFGTFAYIMPQERSIDIDTELDYRFAQFILDSKR